MGAQGTATLDFGATPGSSFTETVIAGQAGILSGSLCEAFMMGDTTVDHNAYEHAVVPLRLTCGSIVAGVGFTITAVSDWRLDGTFVVHWVWN